MVSRARLILTALLATMALACNDGGSPPPGVGGPGEPPPPLVEKLVFVSSVLFTGNVGGVDAADAECQALADAAMLGGTWMAWMSDVTSSPDLDFSHDVGPYVLVDGTPIADDWADLTDGTLTNPIDLDEYGQPAPQSEQMCGGSRTWVLTGTYEAGTHTGAGSDCSGWTSDLGGGTWGRFDQTANWSFACSGGATSDRCGRSAPIFCFEQ